MCEKKRLKRNLQFGKNNIIKKGIEIYYDGANYFMNKNSFFEVYVFDERESQILNEIWNNPNWFEDATIKYFNVPIQDKIILDFDISKIEDEN